MTTWEGRIEVRLPELMAQPMVHSWSCSPASLSPPFPPLDAGTSKVLYAFCPLSCTGLSVVHGVSSLLDREFWTRL